MRFSIRYKLIALVVSTVVVTAYLASILALVLLGFAVEDSLSRRSLVVAEALSASSEIQLLVVERTGGTESRLGPSASIKNATGFVQKLIQADEELDFVILVSTAGEELLEVVTHPGELRFGELDLVGDSERLEFVRQVLAGRAPVQDGHMVVSAPLFSQANRGLPNTQVILGFDSSVQLSRYNRALVLSYLQLGVALLGLLLLFFARFERRVALIGAYANEIASGHLSVPPPDVGNDELGDIVRELSAIRVELGSTVSSISVASDEVEAISSDVAEVSRRIAGDAGTQALSLQSASSAMSALASSSSTVDTTVRELIRIADSSFGRLQDLVSEIESIGFAVDELTGAVEHVQRFFDESERGLAQVEREARVLSGTAQDTAAAMNQMTASISSVESGTDDAMNRSRESTRQAETGVELARDVLSAFDGIRQNSMETAESVRFLSERVESIESILAVISDIANQTKLLSLNASIIAAQAGDHGRGFLVVADEIKALASKTAGSTKEIAEVIGEVQSVAKDAIRVAEGSMTRVELEVGRVDDADEALTAIRRSSSVLEDVIRRIGSAMSEQSRSAAQVNRSMQEVYSTSGSVGGLVHRQLESGRQLKRAMTDVVQLLERTLTTSREKARSAQDATDSLMTMFAQLERVREANAEQGQLRDSVLHAVEQIRGLSSRNRESAKLLASAVDNVTSKVRGLAEAVAAIDDTATPEA